MCMSFNTLHASGTKFLPCEENGMIVIFCVPGVLLLLQIGPAAHVLQTLRWVSKFNEARGLKQKPTQREKGRPQCEDN